MHTSRQVLKIKPKVNQRRCPPPTNTILPSPLAMAQTGGIPASNGAPVNGETLLALITSLQGLTLALQSKEFILPPLF